MDIELKQKVDYLSKWADGKKAPPYTLTLGVTHDCNLRCRFCAQRPRKYLKNFKLAEELSEEQLVRITKEAGELGVKKLNVSGGGEPFLRLKTAIRVMQTARKYGMNGGTSTNGTMLTEDAIKTLVEIGWGVINFSIDGPNAEVHDYLRDQPGCFDKAMKAIKCFNYWKHKFDSYMPELRFQTVLVNRNYKHVSKMIELAYEMEFKKIIFIPVTIHHKEGEALKLKEKEVQEFQRCISEAKELAKKYKIDVNLDDFIDSSLVLNTNEMDKVMLSNNKAYKENKKSDTKIGNLFRRIPCYEPWLTLVIHPTGFIDPCEMENNISYVGNRGLKDIWYNDKFLNKIRNCFIQKDLFKMCAKCCEPSVVKNKEINDSFNLIYKGDRY